MSRRTLGLVIGVVGAIAGGVSPAASTPGAPLESVFETPRPDREDVIYFRNRDVLRGQVLNEKITIAAPYGTLTVPVRECAGLSLEGTRTNTEEVVLVNFNRVTGILLDHVIRLRTGPSATEVAIRKEKIRLVLLGKRPDETAVIEERPGADLFVMTNGDVLTGEAVERKVALRTDFGPLPVLFAEMRDLRTRGEENGGVAITKTNGDTIHGMLETETLSLRLALGEDLPAVYKDQFAKILIGQARTQAAVEFGTPAPVWGDSGAGPAAPMDRMLTLYLGRQVTMKLALIPAGKFVMGSPAEEADRHDDEGPLREVILSKPFYMGIHEVTQNQYAALMGNNPAGFKGANKPVETVSWDDALEFCRRLSQRAGRKVSLPSEAQWEYACRAGSKGRFCFGNEDKQLATYARFGQSGEAGTVPVGMGRPNAWGLYDMHGNVTEWCFDWYVGSYAGIPAVDPTGPSVGQAHVVRGGCWGNPAADCRAATRKGFSSDSRNSYRGFRVVAEAN